MEKGLGEEVLSSSSRTGMRYEVSESYLLRSS